MKTEFFIAKRIIQDKKRKKNLSRPVILISTLSIVLGVAIMIITVSVVKGFQGAIREKVVGFDAHIQIAEIGTSNSMESAPMSLREPFIQKIESLPLTANAQSYAFKPGVLQNYQRIEEKNNRSNEIQGVLFKGVNTDFNSTFIEENLVDGRVPNWQDSPNDILLSATISTQMGYALNDEVEAFFIIDNKPKKRKFRIAGIYDTGLQEFDKQLVFCHLSVIQKLNGWGIRTFAFLEDSCAGKNYVLRAKNSGGNKNYRYNWGEGLTVNDFFLIDGRKSRTIKLISGDYKNQIYGQRGAPNFIPDTATIIIKVDTACNCSQDLLNKIQWNESNNSYTTPFGKVEIQNGQGTGKYYAGGIEINAMDESKIDALNDEILNIISYETPYQSKKITERHQDIFNWLNFLNLNINIVIVLILIVSLINMITSLLVLILEKTNMIGILKAIGATNKNIRLVFVYHAFHLLSRGLLWGNLIGIGLILLQKFTGFLKLNPAVYFLDKVPVSINLWHILLINLLTIITCRVILILPSFLIGKLRPIRAIKFD